MYSDSGMKFIEHGGKIVSFDRGAVSPQEAWLIAYNNKKENIHNMAKMWSCVRELGCTYSPKHMALLDELKAPFIYSPGFH